MEEWAEQHKFWADTIRTIVLGVLGTILIATVVESIRNDIAYSSEKQKAKLSLRINTIKDFSETSYHFTSLAVRFKEGSLSFIDLRDVYDNYRVIQHQMELLIETENIKGQMQKIADRMLLILTKRDSLNNATNDFEKIRLEIKQQSDFVEISALDNL